MRYLCVRVCIWVDSRSVYRRKCMEENQQLLSFNAVCLFNRLMYAELYILGYALNRILFFLSYFLFQQKSFEYLLLFHFLFYSKLLLKTEILICCVSSAYYQLQPYILGIHTVIRLNKAVVGYCFVFYFDSYFPLKLYLK